MERSVFAERLANASELCREFTSSLIMEELFDVYRYFIELNCSYDSNVTPQDTVILFPDDREIYGECTGPVDSDGVISLLWREKHVPEWIDISVWGISNQTTYFKLLCCGRFNEDENKLYYGWNSWNDQPLAPFGVKGPPIPRRHSLAALENRPIEKYSILESNTDFPYR